MTRTVAFLLPVAAAIMLTGASPLAQSTPPTFTSRTDLVVLHVNVFDGKSDAVPNLPQSAFTVYEDGRPQPITFFNDADVPVAVGLVIDNSSSMLTHRKMVLAGGAAFAESSHPEDDLFTIVFNEHVRTGLPPSVPFTRNGQMLRAALNPYPPGGLTALYDAVFEALGHLDTATLQKRVLVVMSDGGDNASRRSRQDMFHRASRSDALIYTVWTGDLTSNLGNRGVLRDLADKSGGLLYAPRSEDDVVRAFTEIAGNIRRGYSIGYVPSSPAKDGDYHRVKVLVRVPGKSLSVRVRDGYAAEATAIAAGDDACR